MEKKNKARLLRERAAFWKGLAAGAALCALLALLAYSLWKAGLLPEAWQPDAVQRTHETEAEGTLRIQIFDVDEGAACALIYYGAQETDCWLVDTGYWDFGQILADKLEWLEVSAVDVCMLSHLHADHCGAFPALAERLPVQTVMLPDCSYDSATAARAEQTVQEFGMDVIHPDMGEVYYLDSAGQVKLTILAPDASRLREDIIQAEADGDEFDINDSSIAFLLEYGSFSYLSWGDGTSGYTEEMMLESGLLTAPDVVMAAHHGSGASSGEALLQRITSPDKLQYAVFSVGNPESVYGYNTYGHPRADICERYKSMGYQLWRTDMSGDITILTDGTDMTIHAGL